MKTTREVGLYVHIPFCRQRCHFCAFYLEVARAERIDAFCCALEREIRLHATQDTLGGRPLKSIYFGGGTPTALPVQNLSALLHRIRETWPTSSPVEVTVEAHPSTVTADDMRTLADAGFNRISFGAESMNDEDLHAIGRPGSVHDTERAVIEARAAGFANINLDLMYGLPGQSVTSWAATLHALLALDPSHISCYALTIEEGTRLAHDIVRELGVKPDEARQLDMESVAESLLTASGFGRYEISNYAKPGYACRHNLLYWTDQDYLGLGPSAQSYVNGVRFGDVADLSAYMDRVGKDTLPLIERTELSRAQQQRDALIFGLRLIQGVSADAVAEGLATPAARTALEQLLAQGLIESKADRLKLTRLGLRYADTVAEELF